MKTNQNKMSFDKLKLNIPGKRNAKVLKALRKKRGYTLYDLSDLSGLSPSYISRLEASDRRLNTEIMFKLAQALGCEPSDFLKSDVSSVKFKEESHQKNLPVFRVLGADVLDGAAKHPKIFLEDPVDHLFRSARLSSAVSAFAIYNPEENKFFNRGDLLIADPSRSVSVNEIVLIINSNKEIFTGRLKSLDSECVILNHATDSEERFSSEDLEAVYPIVSVELCQVNEK